MRLVTPVSIRLFLVMILICISIGLSNAKDDGTDHSITIEKWIESNAINEDGSFILTVDRVVLINEERAIQGISQQQLSYNRTLETLAVVEAYTQKADGRKVKVEPHQIKDQQERESSDAPMFQDTRVKVVIFPEVEVGDRLVLQYKKNRTTALFPGQFSDFSTPTNFVSKHISYIYDVPETVSLYSDAMGYVATELVRKSGRKIYRWDYVPGEKPRLEQDAVSQIDFGQYLAVSTFIDFHALAQAYNARAKDKSDVTPEINKLAHALTADLSDPRAKAFALSDWVRKNIRYVAVYIGAGGFIPHASNAILSNRYGDCKDHAALLEALLKAIGIESTPALISTQYTYILPDVAVPNAFDHAITYIPSLNLYLDSTATNVASGYLPVEELDKPVLLTKQGKIARTPLTQNDHIKNVTIFKVDANGAADFTHSSEATGLRAEQRRHTIRYATPTDRDLIVQRALSETGLKGSGILEVGELDNSGKQYEFKMAGHIENLVNLPGPVGITVFNNFTPGIAAVVQNIAIEKDRTQSFVCFAEQRDEQSRFEFPQDVKVIALPKAISIHDAKFDYTSEYFHESKTVVVNRHYRLRHKDSTVCSPEDFKSMRPAIDAMLRDLKSQIIVQSL
jgi:transglutaminase-like putative cysteine protease